MSSILGDYERPRRPFPIFSLSRDDLHWTLLLSIVCFYVAVVIRASQAEHIVEVKSAWKGCLVVFGIIMGLVFGVLSAAKMFCGYGTGFFQDEVKPEYQAIDEQRQTQNVVTTSQHDATDVEVRILETKTTKQTNFTQSRFEETRVSRAGERDGSGSARGVDPPRSARSDASRSSRSLSGHRDEEIDCGLILEVAAQEFDLNGVRYPRGTFRVVRLERDGVCERQGACSMGDVLFSVDSKPVTGMEPARVRALLRGRAGTSIVLGIYTSQSRDVVKRHVVLAPSPSSITLSPRFHAAHRV